jgi:ATP-dependent 26S proteasome regulatory subunit
VERPSRFDRKYHFGLPAPAERASFLGAWNQRIAAEMRIGAGDVERLIAGTQGFSFAYLKELYVSSMMRWMMDQKIGAMAAILAEQLETLRAQMRSGAAGAVSPPAPTGDEEDDED